MSGEAAEKTGKERFCEGELRLQGAYILYLHGRGNIRKLSRAAALSREK